MKKFLTLLLLTITAFTFKATAQGTTCNAEFTSALITGNTVKFTPAVNDSPLVHHLWNFGDGSATSQVVSPTHTYLTNGSFAIVHTVVRYTPNNIPVCTQSITHTVLIQQAPPACTLVVDFSWTNTAANPLVIAFQNLSVPLAATDSITWQFGDATTSHDVNPVHTYASAGTYNVCLIVKKNTSATAPPCIKYICKTVVVTVPCTLVADFNWTVTATNPLRLEFHNLSTPLAATDSISWTFGDGSTSTDVNPVHTYNVAGTYAVCLRVKKFPNNTSAPCVREICKTVVVTTPCTLVADFNWTVTATNPLRLEFHNLSTPLAATDSISWTFGDGSTSTDVNPVHTYNVAGTYVVCLRVKKLTPPGSAPCVREICKTVVVTTPCTLVADFNWTVTATNPLRLEFHNLSTPLAATDSISWTFGDGSTSTDVNPVHTYNVAGTYIVCLRVKKLTPPGSAPCVREICKTVVVTSPCTLVADFNWTVTATNPLRLEFHNLSTPLAATDSISWTFGDGSTSTDVNPVHTYNVAGTYIVCLRVKKLTPPGSAPCVREICKTIVVTAPCNMIPDFTWTATPTNPLRIEFHNTSTNTAATDSIRWTFGDGSTSNQVNPVHIYSAPGTYTVCLRITRYNAGTTAPCVREICKTVVIPPLCVLEVNFSSQPDSGNTLRIKFTNLSVPVIATDSLFWNFGDGTTLTGVQGDPNVANPTHNYANAGNYNVCLIVKKHPNTISTPCIKYLCKTVVVFAPCTLVVNFTSLADPANPLRVKFTNTSTPISTTDSVRWTFGDGTSVSGLQSDPNVANPTHNYTTAATYTVCLRVKKNSSATTPVACVREKCSSVVVTAPCNFVVNFSWRLDSINVKKVYFTNLTTPPAANSTAVWNFGDGTSATSWNAVHEYAQPGQYRVCLRVYSGLNTTCFREKCDTVIVPVPAPPCTQLSQYHFENVPGDNQKYKFTPDYINTTYQYTWTFGDGTGSHDPVAIHRYARPGVYVACLTAWRGAECASTTCKEIRVLAQINCDSAHVSYSYQRNPQVPNKIQFYANASLPILDQTWYIYKLNGTIASPPVILHQNNPVYLFQDTGYFRVCLRAVVLGGCVKEYCSNIRIEQISNACELQAFPNPATSAVNVNVYLTQPEMIHAYVYNSLNVLVLQKDQQGITGNNLVTLNINTLVAGQYTIKLVYGNRVCYARFQKL